MMVTKPRRKEIQLHGVRTIALNTHIGWPQNNSKSTEIKHLKKKSRIKVESERKR